MSLSFCSVLHGSYAVYCILFVLGIYTMPFLYEHVYYTCTNKHLTQGIRFLTDKGLLNRTPEDIATFLFVSQLDKGAIGDYLGGG